MNNTQHTPMLHHRKEAERYSEPRNPHSANYAIRSDPNPLQEDPDIEDDIVYCVNPECLVTDAQLDTCAKHFSAYYGVWSQFASTETDGQAEAGSKIRMKPDQLRAQSLPDGANNILITAVTAEGRQVAHCFVSQWIRGNDRIWWITQLLVLPSYRNQRRATKMLQALVLHCNIGRVPCTKDFVGILSPHPYSIAAVLRVFGRGIECLPSKPDWEKKPNDYPDAPLQSHKCLPFLQCSPVEYVRDATPCLKTLTAHTGFFIDHTVSNRSLQRLVFAMNKQVREPWQWLFGSLVEGSEYLCVLHFQFDPDHKMQPKFCKSPVISLGEASLADFVANISIKPVHHRYSRLISRSLINYAEIDRYLCDFPESCSLDPRLRYRTHISMATRAIARRVLEAKSLLSRHQLGIVEVMGAKQIPESLRPVYSDVLSPVPDYTSTWRNINEYTQEVFEEDPNFSTRLLILQAIHFKELKDEFEKRRKDEAEKRQKEKERRQTNDAKKKAEEERKKKSVERKLTDKEKRQSSDAHTMACKTKPVHSQLPSTAPSRTRRLSTSRYESSLFVTSQRKPSASTQVTSTAQPRIDSAHKPIASLAQRHKSLSPSPGLFFPDRSSRESCRSDVLTRQFPRNSGNTLSREKRP